MPVFSTPSLHHRAPEWTTAWRPGGNDKPRSNTMRREADGTMRGATWVPAGKGPDIRATRRAPGRALARRPDMLRRTAEDHPLRPVTRLGVAPPPPRTMPIASPPPHPTPTQPLLGPCARYMRFGGTD